MSKITVADILPLVEPNRGNVAAIARRLGVTRGAIWYRCQESPTLMAALTDARERMLDDAETMLYKKVLDGSTPELLFFLKTQGRNRGYVEKQELDTRQVVEMSITDWRKQSEASRKQVAATLADFDDDDSE